MNNDLFYCYSPKLKKELQDLEFKWIRTDKHKTTNRIFWVYQITQELKDYLVKRKSNII